MTILSLKVSTVKHKIFKIIIILKKYNVSNFVNKLISISYTLIHLRNFNLKKNNNKKYIKCK